MRERGRLGACSKCGTTIVARDVARDGLIHSRSRAAGGPFYTLACPECGEPLAAEREASDAFRLYRRQDLAIGGAMARALGNFIAGPVRRHARDPAPGEPPPATARRTDREPATARPEVPAARFSRELELLGLELPATVDDVKRRFRQLAKEFHPDRFQRASPEARQRAQEMFVRISAAYQSILAATR